MLAGSLVGEEDAARIDVKIEVPIGVRELQRGLHVGNACIGDDAVDLPEGCDRFGKSGLHALPSRHVHGDCDGIGRDPGGGGSSRCRVDIGDGDAHAMGMQGRGDCAPNPGRAAGDQRGLASEIATDPLLHCRVHPHPVSFRNHNSGKAAVKQKRTG